MKAGDKAHAAVQQLQAQAAKFAAGQASGQCQWITLTRSHAHTARREEAETRPNQDAVFVVLPVALLLLTRALLLSAWLPLQRR